MKGKIGMKVRWSSGSGGYYTEKLGIIEAVVPAGESPRCYAEQLAVKHGIKAPVLGLARDHESYLVRVPTKTEKAGKLYWPRVAALEAEE